MTRESEEDNVKALPIGTKASGYVHCLLRVWGGQGRDGAGRKEGSNDVHVLRPGEVTTNLDVSSQKIASVWCIIAYYCVFIS